MMYRPGTAYRLARLCKPTGRTQIKYTTAAKALGLEPATTSGRLAWISAGLVLTGIGISSVRVASTN